MKKHLFQAATLLVAATALFTGCDKSENVIEDPTGGLVQFVAKAATGDPETRIGYNDSGSRMSYRWGDLDTEKFSVFYGPYSNTKYDFSLKGGAHSNNGRFEGQLPQPSGTTYATYPSLNANPASLMSIPHDLSSQGLYTTADALFGNRYHLLWATANANNGEVDYQFAHKTSMLKLELTFTGVTSKIKSVSIHGAHNKANLNVLSGVLSYTDAGKGVITVSDATGFDLVDNVLTAYVYLFPEDLTSSTLIIMATDEEGMIYTSGDFNGRALAAGTVYRLRKDMTDSDYIVFGNLKWAKGNLIADGPNGAKIGASGDGGLYFQYGSLVGWNGGGNDDGTGRGTGSSLSIQAKPAVCPINTWNSSWSGDPTTDVPETGNGDPCRYYLGDPWRLPRSAEYNALFGKGETFHMNIPWGPETDALGWSKEGVFSDNSTTSYISHISGLKFPLMGAREYTNGAHNYNGFFGYYWSASTFTSSSKYALSINEDRNIAPDFPIPKEYGMPIRCVRE